METSDPSSNDGRNQRQFAALPAALAFASLECLVVLQALLAYRDHFLTVSQMQQRGIDHGLPFVWHFAMWSDLCIVSPLAAYVIGRYCRQWRVRWMLLSLALGFISAVLLSWIYTFSWMPEAHIQNHRLTGAGVGHLFYMAIALAAFTQFFFFTQDISVQSLRVVSVLLFVHVLIGTHMALGVLNFISPLDWYPAKPLTSVFGWITVGSVGFGLAWRNFGISEIVFAFESAARHLWRATVAVYMFLTMEDPRPLEGYFKFLNRVSDSVIAATYFFTLFRLGLQQGGNALPLALMFVIAARYFFSRVSVKQELEIGKSLFPPGKVPDDLRLKDRVEITIRVIGFLVAYFLLGSFSDHIFLASAILTVIACNDFVTRFVIDKNIERTFSDPTYAPLRNEKDYSTIRKKRVVARWYLFKLPHLWKEAGCAIGCAIACGLTIYGCFNGLNLDFYAYATLIGTLILNEIITLWWRIARYRLLNAVDEESL